MLPSETFYIIHKTKNKCTFLGFMVPFKLKDEITKQNSYSSWLTKLITPQIYTYVIAWPLLNPCKDFPSSFCNEIFFFPLPSICLFLHCKPSVAFSPPPEMLLDQHFLLPITLQHKTVCKFGKKYVLEDSSERKGHHMRTHTN